MAIGTTLSAYSRAVPHYVTLMRWTSQGVAGLPAWRERVEEGERAIEAAGGSLVGVYVTLGRYDVVEIFEAPDDDSAAEILMKLQRFGAEHTETLRAFTRDEAENIRVEVSDRSVSRCRARRKTAGDWAVSVTTAFWHGLGTRISSTSAPRSSRRGSSARLSSPKTRSKSGVVR